MGVKAKVGSILLFVRLLFLKTERKIKISRLIIIMVRKWEKLRYFTSAYLIVIPSSTRSQSVGFKHTYIYIYKYIYEA